MEGADILDHISIGPPGRGLPIVALVISIPSEVIGVAMVFIDQFPPAVINEDGKIIGDVLSKYPEFTVVGNSGRRSEGVRRINLRDTFIDDIGLVKGFTPNELVSSTL